MTYYIYKITNLINQKIYIGKTNNPKKRWYLHRWSGKNNKHNYPICRAIHKYGEKNFIFEIIDQSENEQDIMQKEIKYISDFKKNCQIYNITEGGEGVTGYIPTIETRIKLSKANKGKLAGDKNPMFGKGNLILGKNNPFYNKEHTKESKDKMSVKRKGDKNPRALLTIENIKEIKSNKNNLSVKKMAELYSVSTQTIYKILDGTNWSDVEADL